MEIKDFLGNPSELELQMLRYKWKCIQEHELNKIMQRKRVNGG